MATEVTIPQLGESVTEGVIVRWLKQSGDTVQADEPLLELETDKATMEIPAPAPGALQIAVPQGATVRVGQVVASIRDGARAPSASAMPRTAERPAAAAPPAASPPPAASSAPPPVPAAPLPAPSAAPAAPGDGSEPPLSPAVRKLIVERGVDLKQVHGTGKGGRLTKSDVLEHMESTRHVAPAPGPAPTPDVEQASAAEDDEIERTPMTALRRRIAERLVEAQRNAAILTTFNEIDCSAVLAVRQKYRERFKARHGVDLGLMSLFGCAVILALHDVPIVNARIDGENVVHHRRVHLGIAVSTPRGLVVPVVRRADTLSLADLEKAIDALAAKARDGRLVPDDLAGGTFTMTNGGVFGSLLSTPILNPPQSGILGMHKIQERPVAVDGHVVIRPMMYVTLSYDHRLVDGEQAVTFLVRVKDYLEDPARMVIEA